MENYYNVLGVAENATQDEIKKAFRNKSKEHHPDRGGNEEEFKKINEAYTAIGDEQKRAEYDNQRNNPFANMGGNPFGGGDPFDIFASMFGGGRAQRKAPDKIIELNIGAVDSFMGKKIYFNFSRKTNCNTCNGQGGERITCNGCGGSGVISQVIGNGFFQNVMQSHCPKCNGNGFSFKTVCNTCSGEGKVNEDKVIDINLPVGISDGQMIKAQGMGDFHNGMFGDLILKTIIRPQNGFEKSGSDLVYTKYLSLDEFDNDEIRVPHPHGELSIKLPETIDTANPLKVRGKGYRNENGDFYVKLHVKHMRTSKV